eukprot:TRINITY_DN16611_c0_g1_i2.p1 TRINITY_DN16611_c0_g1~~TRINITY_DN16611_c0_g1_i2.p1  ORF type:complete len:519 (+),score=210.24 TRINITY_DN16611_c0_g1_i2:191-1558(+)
MDLAVLVHKGAQAAVQEQVEALRLDDPQAVPEVMSCAVHVKGFKGCVLHQAVFDHRKKLVAYLLPLTPVPLQRDAMFIALRYCKYDLVLYLVAKNPGDVNHQREADGNTILHCACSRPKPPISFIVELCRLKSLKVNLENKQGLAPIHLLALHSTGVEGKDACQALKAKGALLDKTCVLLGPNGEAKGEPKTPLQITKNSFLRQVLTLGARHRRRENPMLMLSSQQVAELDETPLHKLPAIQDPDIGGLGLTLPHHEEEIAPGSKQKKKVGPGEEAELVHRLYAVSKARQEETMDTLLKRFANGSGKKPVQLSADEQEESVQRLYGAHGEQIDRMQGLADKYLTPTQDPKTITQEELQESISRLYDASVAHNKEVQHTLISKYTSIPLVSRRYGGKKLTKDETSECSSRLYDKALEKQKTTLERLRGNYLASPKSTRVMSPADWQKMGERLSQKQ